AGSTSAPPESLAEIITPRAPPGVMYPLTSNPPAVSVSPAWGDWMKTSTGPWTTATVVVGSAGTRSGARVGSNLSWSRTGLRSINRTPTRSRTAARMKGYGWTLRPGRGPFSGARETVGSFWSITWPRVGALRVWQPVAASPGSAQTAGSGEVLVS